MLPLLLTVAALSSPAQTSRDRLPHLDGARLQDELHLLQTTHQLNGRSAERKHEGHRSGMQDGTPSKLLDCPARREWPLPTFEKEGAEEAQSLLSEEAEHGIVDGELVGKCRLPWMAFIYADRSTSQKVQGLCSGSLITNQHLLTAAHCFYLGESGKPFDWPSVLNGSWVKAGVAQNATSEAEGEVNFIESVSLPYADSWYEEKYGSSDPTQGDIAIVKLKKPIPESKCVSSICLPKKDYIKHGAGWNVAGYGSQNHSLWRGRFRVTEPKDLGGTSLGELGMFSAMGQKWKHAGDHSHNERPKIEPGDSGGPFMVRDGEQIFVAGTVTGFALSWNPLVAQVVYTDVFKYRNWIERAVENPKTSPGGSAAASNKHHADARHKTTQGRG